MVHNLSFVSKGKIDIISDKIVLSKFGVKNPYLLLFFTKGVHFWLNNNKSIHQVRLF